MHPERRQSAYEWHRAPGKDAEPVYGQTEPELRGKVRERVEDDKCLDAFRMCEGEAQRERAAERFANDDRAATALCDDVNHRREIRDQRLHVRGIITQRVSGHSVRPGQQGSLAVKEAPGAVHARNQHHRRSVSLHLHARVVRASHAL